MSVAFERPDASEQDRVLHRSEGHLPLDQIAHVLIHNIPQRVVQHGVVVSLFVELAPAELVQSHIPRIASLHCSDIAALMSKPSPLVMLVMSAPKTIWCGCPSTSPKMSFQWLNNTVANAAFDMIAGTSPFSSVLARLSTFSLAIGETTTSPLTLGVRVYREVGKGEKFGDGKKKHEGKVHKVFITFVQGAHGNHQQGGPAR